MVSGAIRKSWDFCIGVWLDAGRTRGPAHNEEGAADGLPLPSEKKVIGPMKMYVDNKGIIDGLWRGERKGIGPKAGDADLWIKNLGRAASSNVWSM